MDRQLHEELGSVWLDIENDDKTRAVILTGFAQNFSAGGDFNFAQSLIDDFSFRARTWTEAKRLVYNIVNFPKPMISAVRGPAVGAGLACALLADVSIVASDARLIDGHTRLGVAAGDHAALIWPLLCGMAKAKYYLLLCETLSGEEAERIGLVSLCVDGGLLDQTAMDVATRLAEGAPRALSFTKHVLNSWLRMAGPIFDSSLALELLSFSGPEAIEGLSALRGKKNPDFSSD